MLNLATPVTALAPGQLVQADGLPLLEAMNSLTLLDPRMDSGAGIGAAEGVERPTWDPAARVSPVEACAIMDKLLALEVGPCLLKGAAQGLLPTGQMTYHQGVPLVSSLFISRHILAVDFLRSCPDALLDASPATSELPSLALHTYIRLFYLANHLAWHEMIRGNVYDGEDWMSDTCGVWDREGEWPLGDVTVQDLGDMVEQIVGWFEESERE